MSFTRISSNPVVRIAGVAALFFFLPLSGVSFSKTVGVSGRVYPIVEKDAIEEIRERASRVDWGKYLDQKEWKEKIKGYRPPNLTVLHPANEDRSFLVDMTYTLEFDIQDGKGGILYPKGYTFNPLEYLPFSKTIVVINGMDDDEVSWFVNSEYSKRIDVMLLLTDGPWYDLSEEIGRNVFYLTRPVAERFNLVHTPSVVTKKDNQYMEVREFYAEDKNNGN